MKNLMMIISCARKAKTNLPLVSFLVLVFAGTTSVAKADSVSRPMNISVQVIARAVVALESGPSVIEITAADIKRGYAELPGPIVVRVRTNSRNGCVIEFGHTDTSFDSIELVRSEGMANEEGKGTITRSYVPGGESVAVQARIWLRPDIQVGNYPLSLELSARAL